LKHRKPESIIVLSLAAIVLVGFFLTDLIVKFFRKSPTALTATELMLIVVILTGVLLILLLLTWRSWRRIKQEREYFDEE